MEQQVAGNDWAWRAGAVAGLCALLGVVAASADNPLGGTAHVTALGAAAVFVLGGAGGRAVRGHSWVQIGAGVACWTLAGSLATMSAGTVVEVPSLLIGVIYAIGVLPMMVGLASLGEPYDADQQLAGMLDWALLFTLAFGVMWVLAVEPVAFDGTLSLTDRTMASILPAGDLALVLLAARLVTRRKVPAATAWLVLGAVTFLAVSDVSRLAHLRVESATIVQTDVVTHLAGLGLLAAAAVRDRSAPRTLRPPIPATSMAPPWISALVATLASVPPTALVLADLLGDRSLRLGPVMLWIGIVAVLTWWRARAARRSRVRTTEQLSWIASHDPLTGAFRLQSFLDLTSLGSTRDQVGTVLALDLSGLGDVADEHGSDVAELVLVEAASRVRQTLAAGAVIARPADDQLVAFVRSSDLSRGRSMAEAVRAVLCRPIATDEATVSLVVSVGVAQTDGVVIDVGAGLRRAVAAMRHAASTGPGGVAIDAELAGVVVRG